MKRNLTLLLLLSYFIAGSQIWEDQLLKENPNATVFDKEIAFNKYKNEVKYTKGNGYKPYARNLDFILQRTSDGKGIPNGNYIQNG